MSEWIVVNDDELYHHGILGMHWGVRRFQPYPNGKKLKSGKTGVERIKKGVAETVKKAKAAKADIQRKRTDYLNRYAVRQEVKNQENLKRLIAKERVRNAKQEAVNIRNRAEESRVAAKTAEAVEANRHKVSLKEMKMREKMSKKELKDLNKKKSIKDRINDKGTDIKKISDDELIRRTQRLQLEANYRRAKEQSIPQKKKAENMVAKFAKDSLSSLSQNASREIGKFAIDMAMKKVKKELMSPEERKLAEQKEQSNRLNIENNFLKNQNTNERYKAGDFSKNGKGNDDGGGKKDKKEKKQKDNSGGLSKEQNQMIQDALKDFNERQKQIDETRRKYGS